VVRVRVRVRVRLRLRARLLLRVVGAPVLERGHVGVDVPEGDRVRAAHQRVDLAVRRVLGEARLRYRGGIGEI